VRNIKAPTKWTHKGKIHSVGSDGLTICRLEPKGTWEETDEPATCMICQGTAGGWRRQKHKPRECLR